MDAKDILIKLNLSEDKLKLGTRIFQSHCQHCGKSFGYLLVEPDSIIWSKNLVMLDGYERPKPHSGLKCLACGAYYDSAKELFPKLIYIKEREK